MRVAAGAVARKVLGRRDDPRRAGADRPHKIDRANWDWDAGRRQPVLLPRPRRRRRSGKSYLDGIRKAGSSSAR
jgi:chorismate synthase